VIPTLSLFDPKIPMFACNTYFGETKFLNKTKVKNLENPPCNEALNLFMSSA
jgi:hypothetical protein